MKIFHESKLHDLFSEHDLVDLVVAQKRMLPQMSQFSPVIDDFN